MKTFYSFFFFTLFAVSCLGQELSSDYKILSINKKISEYPDKYDLSSPLNACVSFNYIIINGRDGLLAPSSSARIKMYMPDSTAPDSKVTEKRKNYYLNITIKEVVVYKDSIACVIAEYGEDFYSIRYLSFENGKWLNTGEDAGTSVENSRKKFIEKADMFLGYLHRVPVLERVSNDTLSFIHYLEKNGKEPKKFVMDALKKHKLVIYGEIHRREISWKLCKNILKDPGFSKSVGTVFMELSAHKQNVINSFLAKRTLDKELILDVFREVQVDGWYDKGMYEFIIEIWKINQKLPAEKRIKIIAVDIPRPYSLLLTAEDLKNHFDTVMNRNVHMAGVIENYIKNSKDKRNHFFIVGTGHVYKSSTEGFASLSLAGGSAGTAGSLLSRKFKTSEVYTIFTHCPIVNNNGNLGGIIRKGIFDYSFYKTGNKPVAFNLSNSPFGKEPFDALPEISYQASTGTFADNYDGYIFLGPLETESDEYLLYDIVTDNFVKELMRRAEISQTSLKRWFNVEENTKEAIISQMQKDLKKYRWEKLKPLF